MSDEPLGTPVPDPNQRRPGHFDRFGIDNMVAVPLELGYLETIGNDPYRYPVTGTSGHVIPANTPFDYPIPPAEVSPQCWPSRVECHITYDGAPFPVMFVDAPAGQFVESVKFDVTGPALWTAIPIFDVLPA